MIRYRTDGVFTPQGFRRKEPKEMSRRDRVRASQRRLKEIRSWKNEDRS